MVESDQERQEEYKMARERQSIVKMSRREGYALHPKAHKALIKRSVLPGYNSNGRSRGGMRGSQYSLQLREKQKVKRIYGLLEKQFSNLMKESSRTTGQSGIILLQLLEQRLDNVIYRSGFASSRRASRQLATHGHFLLNGSRVDIPSIRLKIGDVLSLRPKSTKSSYFVHLDENSPVPAEVPSWLKVNRKKFEIAVVGIPSREDAEVDINEQLIVEYYSR